ncbi:MAG: group II intron reverse transcriptase/maturase [Cyanobacteria bacterium CAN_BIN43]|nr:group II intron reverse transcriptase/maturase [Cyanobacteria bacterium CAN_BIN43]
MSKAQSNLMMEWKDLPWRKLERKIFKLQKRIFKASQRGDVKTVRRLQKTLMRSWSAKCLAVRRVTQDNQGKKTAGVDGIKSLKPEQRLELVGSLSLSQKAKPTRRVWISKPGTEEKRPLGIPTMADRASQALVKQALEPEWEAKFEPNSYGFRPGRSAHDAIAAIFGCISRKAKYVLDADISKCFDRIDHKALLAKLNTFPTLRRQIKSWLKSGVIDGRTLFPTQEGTPQGGIISPLLANIALHGMEQRINQAFPKKEIWLKNKVIGRRNPAHFIRYADDFVILHEDLEVVQKCQEIIAEWLQQMGLELKPSKTKLTHTLNEYEGNVGFNFLGFMVRQYPTGKHHTSKNTKGEPLGYKTLITPSQEGVSRHQDKLKKIIKVHKASTQLQLINELNPVITGWSNYYSTVVSSQHYSKLDDWLYHLFRSWAEHRHPLKSQYWISDKYWLIDKGGGWKFAAKIQDSIKKIAKHKETPIERPIKVQNSRSPYDGDWIYWSSRMGKHPEVNGGVAALLKRQKGKCPECQLYFREGDILEVDHIAPRSQGGKDEYINLQLLHRHCHDTKTARDFFPAVL